MRIGEQKRILSEILRDLDNLLQNLKAFSYPTSDFRHFFVLNTFFLSRCAQLLCSDREEKLLICGGPVLNNVYLLTEIFCPKLDSSFFHVKPAPGELARVVRILEPFGLQITGIFHSHPGLGIPIPSSADYTYHRIAEQLGYRVLGAVFTNSGYIRFFTHRLNFEVILLGSGIGVVNPQKHVFYIGGLHASSELL